MNFNRIKHLALNELESKSIGKYNYQPLLYSLLWSIGIKVRPPHYQSFVVNFLITGIFFGLLVGISEWILYGNLVFPLPFNAIRHALTSGVLFGLVMALYYLISSRKNKLTKWNNFQITDE
jgi:hypothetical protein